MSDVEVKTLKEYGEKFCNLMNEDEKLTAYVNQTLAETITQASQNILIAQQVNDVKAGSKAVSDAVERIMSFIAFLYAKAREKEDSLKEA